MDNSIVNFIGMDIVERKTAAKKPASSSKRIICGKNATP